MQTILSTGTSSGYGLATARHFLAQGWTVIATLRKPDPGVLPRSENLRILPLDVTSEQSIAAAVRYAEEAGIDAVGSDTGRTVTASASSSPPITSVNQCTPR